MKYFRKNRFFLAIAMLLGVVGGIAFAGLHSAPVSALGECRQQDGWRTVSFINGDGQYVKMGDHRFYQTLKVGSPDRECVRTLQRMVNVFCDQYTDLTVDGQFGTKTYRAVKTLQYEIGYRWHFPVHVNGIGISVDGNAGPQTWSILKEFSWMGMPNGGSVNCNAVW